MQMVESSGLLIGTEGLLRAARELTARNAMTRMAGLVGDLATLRRKHGDLEWVSAVEALRSLGFHDPFLEDPFTGRAFRKPRGYPGDAVLLDLIYGASAAAGLVAGASCLGRAIFDYTSVAAAPHAVRNRRRLLAGQIDRIAAARDGRGGARILSLACGHFREGALSEAISRSSVAEVLALDQDEESLAEVDRCYAARVRTIRASVRGVICGDFDGIRDLDFVYAAGLFDYLSARTAARLLVKMFDWLGPGGTLWVANFVPDARDRGYMEAVMDWWLIYRSAGDLAALADGVPAGRISGLRTFFEQEGNIAFLELAKA